MVVIFFFFTAVESCTSRKKPQCGHLWEFPSSFALLCMVQVFCYFYYVYELRLCQCFGSPKPLFWRGSGETYLAHLLQCVFWLAPAFRGWNECWRQGKLRGRERERESWGKPTLWLRGEVREFPGELDSFYIWSDWSVAWSSAAPHRLGCSGEKSGLIRSPLQAGRAYGQD